MTGRRWDPCVEHRGVETLAFLKKFFADPKRKCCLVGGAGFDPRTVVCAQVLSSVLQARLRGVFLREERSGANPRATAAATANLQRLQTLIPSSDVATVEILAPDNAVVGGRNAVERMRERKFDDVTDIKTSVPQFLDSMKATMPAYLLNASDPEPAINLVDARWQGDLPATFLYNEKGEVVYKHSGRVNTAELRAAIEKVVSRR